MRPLGILGVILIIAGALVLAMRGISYTKDRDSVKIGGVELSKEDRGFVPPVAGVIAIVAGIVLVAAGRKKA
jgi:uncharacterized membrane protein HdeD (DUF308 family)